MDAKPAAVNAPFMISRLDNLPDIVAPLLDKPAGLDAPAGLYVSTAIS
jgi:hypothetical protein